MTLPFDLPPFDFPFLAYIRKAESGLLVPQKAVLPGFSMPLGIYKKPWTPEYLANVVGWWDASDTSTVTLVSGAVSSWASKGNGTMNLAQSTASARPGYSSGQYVNFGSNTWLNPSTTWPEIYDVYIVARPNASTAYRTLLAVNSSNVVATVQASSSAWGKYTSSLQQYGSLTWPNQDGLALVRATSGGVVRSNRDGGAIATASGTVETQVTRVGNNVGGVTNQQFWGRIYEAILVSSNLSDDLRQKVEGYLAHKWGFTNLLPSNHPYKTSEPKV